MRSSQISTSVGMILHLTYMNAPRQGGPILLGHEDAEVRLSLERLLTDLGYCVEISVTGDAVLQRVLTGPPLSAILLDALLPPGDGFTVLNQIRRAANGIPVLMLASAPSTFDIVLAMKSGATDFLSTPVPDRELRAALERALSNAPASLAAETRRSRPASEGRAFVTRNGRMRELNSLVDQVAASEAPVLIQGETGTGKEVLARQLHRQSPRAGRVFLKLNCAALPSELVESELFGYERGAFTGALQRKPGMFEMADGGVLLLDEIGDMDVRLQAKLLQVLQDQEFQRLGGRTVRVDVRVFAATHRDLEQAIAGGSFREDLYYRLNVVNVKLPPLRDRKEDILPLAEYFLDRHTPAGRTPPVIPAELADVMKEYSWPGNIRALENTMRKLIVLRDPSLIARELRARIAAAVMPHADRPDTPDCGGAGEPAVFDKLKQVSRNAEADAILRALDATHWNRKQAATVLRIDYKALLYKMKKLRIDEEPGAPSQADGPLASRTGV